MESRVRRRVACTVRAGGLRKRTDGNISTAPQADPTAARTGRLRAHWGRRLAASLTAPTPAGARTS
jgi:hypothetical protein